MKKILFIIFTFLSIAVFSQGNRTEKIKISKSTFNKSKTLNDIIPTFPKDCDIKQYQFIIDISGPVRTITIKKNEITDDLKLIVKDIKNGQQFFIENVQSDCKIPFKKNYVFVII